MRPFDFSILSLDIYKIDYMLVLHLILFFCIEAELSRRNSEDNLENIPHSKKAVVILKKELAQKTEALNKALKRENELKVC